MAKNTRRFLFLRGGLHVARYAGLTLARFDVPSVAEDEITATGHDDRDPGLESFLEAHVGRFVAEIKPGSERDHRGPGPGPERDLVGQVEGVEIPGGRIFKLHRTGVAAFPGEIKRGAFREFIIFGQAERDR